MVYIYRCLKKDSEPVYHIVDDNGNVPGKDYDKIENLGHARIQICSDVYKSTDLLEMLEWKLPKAYEDLKTHLNEVREKREEIADFNKLIEEIKNYKSNNPEKK